MFFVNQRLRPIPDNPATLSGFTSLAPALRLKVRDAFLERPEIIEVFTDENPARFSPDELNIVRSWRHFVHGKFFVLRELRNHTVFLSSSQPHVAYGAHALADPLEHVIGSGWPAMVETVLLPFKNMIIYEGLITRFNVTFGSGIRRSLNESYREAKTRFGIVTSLPMTQEPLLREAPKAMPAPRPATKEDKDTALRVVMELIEPFCKEHLNEEYAAVCRKMAETLHRKRPSPLLQGKPNAWASGIVRAVGGQNFLHDKTQTPYLRSTDIDRLLGTSPSSGAAKLSAIRKMLKIHRLDPTWTLPSRLDDNPLVWMLKVNGFLMDIRMAPREAQVVAFEKGMIPYIPADRISGES